MDYHLLLTGTVGYLLGSIPFGLVLTQLAGLGDIRKIGSGNIGATNVLRTGNKALAAATLLLDIAKGAVACWLGVLVASYFLPQSATLSASVSNTSPLAMPLAGLGAFIGHLFPIWLGFKGGKGVATYIGVMLALAWQIGLIFCATWLAIAVLLRYSSLSALIAALTAPLAAVFLVVPSTAIASGVMSVLLILKHRANIQRLLTGQEPKIGRASATEPQ